VAADSAGNIYVSGNAGSAGHPVKNSVSTCQPSYAGVPGFLTVFDPSGDLLQSTYLPPGEPVGNGLAIGPGSVFVLGSPANPPLTGFSLTQLLPDPTAQPVQLACVGNAASVEPGPIEAGELVSLFGEGLGPKQGTQPQVSLKSGVPSQVANVRVTFNGTASPLLYVQDSQINAIVPWSLAGASTAEICVFYNGAETNCLEQTVAATAAGVFTTDGYHARGSQPGWHHQFGCESGAARLDHVDLRDGPGAHRSTTKRWLNRASATPHQYHSYSGLRRAG
jgi:hypothetical protein